MDYHFRVDLWIFIKKYSILLIKSLFSNITNPPNNKNYC